MGKKRKRARHRKIAPAAAPAQATNRPESSIAAGVTGVFSFFLGIAFIPGIADAAGAPRWALLSLFVPLMLAAIGRTRVTLGHLILAFYVLWAAITLAWSPGLYDGLDALWKLLLIAGLFAIGAELPTLRPIALGLGLAIALNSAFVLAQAAGFDPVPHMPGPTGMGAGLFMNRNSLAEAAALVLILVLAHRLWWLVPVIVPSLIWFEPGMRQGAHVWYPTAQGALTALGVAGTAWLWTKSRLAALLLIMAVAIGVAFAVYTRVNASVPERLAIWTVTARGLTPQGNGLGSFYLRFPAHVAETDPLVTRPINAHNDLLQIAYETGLPGAVLVLAFGALLLFTRGAVGERLVLLAFFVEGCFANPLGLPVSAFVAALCAGRVCRARPRLRDDLAHWRVSLRADLERLAAARQGGRAA